MIYLKIIILNYQNLILVLILLEKQFGKILILIVLKLIDLLYNYKNLLIKNLILNQDSILQIIY